MRIWLVNPFDPVPGEDSRPGRYSHLALMLAEQGHDVTWWTSNFSHTAKEFRSKTLKDYKLNEHLRIIMVNTTKYIKNIGLARIRSQYLYATRYYKMALTFPFPDIILASVPPLYSPVLSVKLAKIMGAKVIMDVQDLWPDGYSVLLPGFLQPMTNYLFFPVALMANTVYRNAHGVMSMSEGFLSRALEALRSPETKPNFVLYLGIDLDYFDSITERAFELDGVFPGEDSSFIALYAGSIGKTSDIFTILEAARRLRGSHPSIKFVIAGTGPLLAAVKSRCNAMQIDNVAITGFLDYPRLKYLLRHASAGLVAYGKGVETSFPNKPYDYMAAGLALISSIRGEFEEMVKSEEIGLQYEAGNPLSLAEAVVHLYENRPLQNEMGRRAREVAELRFDRRRTYPQIIGFLEDVLSSRA